MNRNHWSSYIERQNPAYRATPIPPEFAADMVVVIPCYDEPSLFDTLYSLLACVRPNARVCTVIVFNSGERSSSEGIIQNRISFQQTNEFIEKYNDEGFRFFPLLFEGLPRKHAGVGLARKIGMDVAVEHFLSTGNCRGVIVSLDADCTVSDNFLSAIHHAFISDNHLNATVHNFRHRIYNSTRALENAVKQYEAYIRYYRAMLRFIGFPWYYHTIGSAFAVTADAYVRVGGMGRQQGGEDFYFLQKVFALEEIRELNDVWVYPLARFSDRVPFGTGPALQKIINRRGEILKVYSREAFVSLKQFFEMKDAFYLKNNQEVLDMLTALHPALQRFLKETLFMDDIADCNRNCASPAAFQKRFFHHFNAFRIIKYLNAVHPEPFPLEKIMSVVDKY